ncbi:hypothetical protein DERF_003281 [Dermatophagoides farinae]|uniref:Uncharacterized protein n=1 Tax=Dermatophagoides farinae TaxID=6954 RepID=A0A922IGJ5_DERFA|nr:hypothetical protein DERF_003281 [Dermatophagoides farinae]
MFVHGEILDHLWLFLLIFGPLCASLHSIHNECTSIILLMCSLTNFHLLKIIIIIIIISLFVKTYSFVQNESDLIVLIYGCEFFFIIIQFLAIGSNQLVDLLNDEEKKIPLFARFAQHDALQILNFANI